jgi:hypothetical protein
MRACRENCATQSGREVSGDDGNGTGTNFFRVGDGSEAGWRADRDLGARKWVMEDAVKVVGGGGIRSEVRCCWWLDTGR